MISGEVTKQFPWDWDYCEEGQCVNPSKNFPGSREAWEGQTNEFQETWIRWILARKLCALWLVEKGLADKNQIAVDLPSDEPIF